MQPMTNEGSISTTRVRDISDDELREQMIVMAAVRQGVRLAALDVFMVSCIGWIVGTLVFTPAWKGLVAWWWS